MHQRGFFKVSGFDSQFLYSKPETELMPLAWKTHVDLPLRMAEVPLAAWDVGFLPVAKLFFPFAGMAV